MALSCIIFDLFNFKNTPTLKSGSEVTQGHSKLASFNRLPVVYY